MQKTIQNTDITAAEIKTYVMHLPTENHELLLFIPQEKLYLKQLYFKETPSTSLASRPTYTYIDDEVLQQVGD